MRVVLQRVSSATVISNEFFNEIRQGYCLLVGVSKDSTEEDALKLAEKIAASRNFEDESGKINLSIKDVGGEILSISQFTLYADVRKGNRPSFTEAAGKEHADRLYRLFNAHLQKMDLTVKEGFFGEMMNVQINNDGPITILYESIGGKIQ
ncbi:D-aminoacyl-tRNA deacylase [Salinicoccus roseus]|jgi:D-tyrosyl-tRNA(Tyr) deacylase|uniref:D-aminoacyl-tRNA deacylase n=1 Tax=Salinicoccus roseus TaxID=45670 RepID=A0A265E9H6_9STAP|nr:D-aminoacyl-tRNA deacylase [Salinicoccus roseus]MBY8908283.1 D-tyrosyl-tRNA(Tyr) deacylase [Salinicoccus roseus]OZT78233.1 D-tyrosyl-tRNA(Tyr) deacylase [Salinicoccus roseus]RPE54316.1 D-tyrosyl-tRNA(Tyr) deacylase [Salinicoccus roseus]GGA66438.1 D-aminoacyl-tRNA deacylase [Salinicoccus roseus]